MTSPAIPRWACHALAAALWLAAWQATTLLAAPDNLPIDPPHGATEAAALLNARLAATGSGPAAFVGTAQCLVCHASKLEDTPRSHPAALEYAQSGEWAGHSCEVCHGPGSIHLVGGGNNDGTIQPLKIPAKEANAICLECHAGTAWGTSHDWLTAPHNLAEVACVTCHDPHRETPHGLRPLDSGGAIGIGHANRRPQEPLVVGPPFSGPDSAVNDWRFSSAERPFASTERFCLSCHSDRALDFKQRSHHPLEAAGMSCTTCHNPHKEAVNNSDLISKTNGLCESCHTQFAGPFRFNHAPVHDVALGDGCMTCHDPHGSTNQNLLKIGDRGLCLQCHMDKDTVGPQPHFAGTCWASGCHQQVHGSDTDPYFIDDSFDGLAVLH